VDCGAVVHGSGTYVCMEGPAFSTRAESHLYRAWGMDVIGMTNLTEAKLAREAEICYATLALVTDYDCWHDEEEDVTVRAILETLQANAHLAAEALRQTVTPSPKAALAPAAGRLDGAIATDRAMLSADVQDTPGAHPGQGAGVTAASSHPGGGVGGLRRRADTPSGGSGPAGRIGHALLRGRLLLHARAPGRGGGRGLHGDARGAPARARRGPRGPAAPGRPDLSLGGGVRLRPQQPAHARHPAERLCGVLPRAPPGWEDTPVVFLANIDPELQASVRGMVGSRAWWPRTP
jgi:hypothetical protein